ncbi:hypothetical protein BLL42_23775 [Pseudomonas frederiksbergensis]|uniref:Uncharacterized protein n=1 Tax=Pseudomonas frederiksbergensis TaxID=104087 RepID=A0A1J0ERX3_9PSED|nr:hypothetical protein BLL42_23775 [Pseudomonas frederiksbergensis]
MPLPLVSWSLYFERNRCSIGRIWVFASVIQSLRKFRFFVQQIKKVGAEDTYMNIGEVLIK